MENRPDPYAINPKGRDVKVAVVDSGIDVSHPGIGRIAGGIDLTESGREGSEATDPAGHGTACAGIILQHASGVELYSVKILDRTLTCPGQRLLEAVRWTVEHGIHVVNLSLGTTKIEYRKPLEQLCTQAEKAGAILVAAQHNKGCESYPAVFPNVIGIGGTTGAAPWVSRPGQPVELLARTDSQRVCWTGGRNVLIRGNSFAAPHITGMVCRIKEAWPGATLNEIRIILHTGISAPRRESAPFHGHPSSDRPVNPGLQCHAKRHGPISEAHAVSSCCNRS